MLILRGRVRGAEKEGVGRCSRGVRTVMGTPVVS